MGGRTHRTDLERVVAYFSALTPSALDRIGDIYAPDAHFRDPFNDVTGTTEIAGIFRHMYAAVDAPRFVIDTQLLDGSQAMLGWTFHLQLRGRALAIRGVSHLRFAADGRIAEHIDHWDAAGELYARLPVIGAAMRWLRRRLSVGPVANRS